MLVARILILGPTAPPDQPAPRREPPPSASQPGRTPTPPPEPNGAQYATHLV